MDKPQLTSVHFYIHASPADLWATGRASYKAEQLRRQRFCNSVPQILEVSPSELEICGQSLSEKTTKNLSFWNYIWSMLFNTLVFCSEALVDVYLDRCNRNNIYKIIYLLYLMKLQVLLLISVPDDLVGLLFLVTIFVIMKSKGSLLKCVMCLPQKQCVRFCLSSV